MQDGEVAISDQVVLPSGNIAVTGVYGDVNSVYEPFIALFNASGNLLNAIGYTGFPRPFSATHNIVYDEDMDRLIVCGTNRVQDPFQFIHCPDQTAFVLNVEASNLAMVHWCSFMDSGAGGSDYDLAENLLVLQEGIFVSGSTNDFGSGDQLVMYALLDRAFRAKPIF